MVELYLLGTAILVIAGMQAMMMGGIQQIRKQLELGQSQQASPTEPSREAASSPSPPTSPLPKE
jgi:hypothetical protein